MVIGRFLGLARKIAHKQDRQVSIIPPVLPTITDRERAKAALIHSNHPGFTSRQHANEGNLHVNNDWKNQPLFS